MYAIRNRTVIDVEGIGRRVIAVLSAGDSGMAVVSCRAPPVPDVDLAPRLRPDVLHQESERRPRGHQFLGGRK